MPARATRALLATALVALFLAGSVARASAGPRLFTAASDTRSARSVVLQASPSERVRFVAEKGSSILVHGTYPRVESSCARPVQPILHARYEGTIEVGRHSDGTLFLIGILPFEDYLEGIAEVPRTWPMAALKAQVVAARTYALARMGRPSEEGLRLGYQLCATDQCQVYRGLGIGEGPYGDRWRKAVRDTRGQALLYGGSPADTLYFSTSNGRTYGNEDVFGSSPLPYLRPREERDDGASSVSRWRARLPYADVARFLRAAGYWSGGSITSVQLEGGTMVIRGGGAVSRMSATDFRIQMNSWAPCLAPDRYPQVDAGLRLPQTVPSKWFSVSNSGGEVVLEGRGWGHGVGMVQWGAYGKAQRGMPYGDILAFYYNGLRPQKVSVPGEIRVGIAVGLKTLRVEGIGEVRLEGQRPRPGPWLVTGPDRVRVKRSGPVPRYIEPGRLVSGPDEATSGRKIRARVFVPELSVARLALTVDGTEVPIGPFRTAQPGETTITGTLPELATGTYELTAQVSDGIDVLSTEARRLRVSGVAPTPSPTPSPTPESPSPSPTESSPRAAPLEPADRSSPLWPAAISVAAVLGLFVALALLRRRAARPR